jgi:hypothetical protein
MDVAAGVKGMVSCWNCFAVIARERSDEAIQTKPR